MGRRLDCVAPYFNHTMMTSSSNVFCRQIADVIMAHGVDTAYISPGSRNASLVLAFEARKKIHKYVVVDERSAAFQALGCALVTKKPVLLLCTSGTAVLNYAPAVAEAYYAGVPLIVVSADRPAEWIDQDDSQTIRQYGVLNSIVKGSYDVRAIPEGSLCEYSADLKWMINRTVNEAMLNALDGKPGPVHINVQLGEPLGDCSSVDDATQRKVSLVKTKESIDVSALKSMASLLCSSKVLLVAGSLPPDDDLIKAVRKFASLPNVIVMAETLSNLHDPLDCSTMIDSVLCRMTEAERESMRPDIVISIGGALVSRMLKQYLRSCQPKHHWSVGHSNYFCDCFKCLTDKVEIAPASFFKQVYSVVKKLTISHEVDNYSSSWLSLRKTAKEVADNYIKNCGWSDLKVFDILMKSMEFDNLFVSNGTSVRYSQLLPHKCHAEYCNRGVSGIDGMTSTAVGAAHAYKGKTMLISGDTSWLYDSGASALCDVPPTMRMVVIDNSGGGIFRFIKATSEIPSETLERYFCVRDQMDVAILSKAYGIETIEADDEESLYEGIKWLSESSECPRLLVVRTFAAESAQILRNYFNLNKKK